MSSLLAIVGMWTDGTARATGGANTIIYPVVITDIVYDKPMNLSAWITNDGRVYSVQKVVRPI